MAELWRPQQRNLIDSETLQELRKTEAVYLKDLSGLIACCHYNASLTSSSLQVDIAINGNLKNITSALLKTHLHLKQQILSLDDDSGLILPQLINWMTEAIPLYSQYINYYSFDQDQPEREIYLKRRPLVRIRYITKVLSKMTEQEMDPQLRQIISDFYERFSLELSNARDKDDTERVKISKSTVFFDEVKCLETMAATASNFKLSDILLRENFQLSLKHPQKLAKLDIEVELFALVDPAATNMMAHVLRKDERPLLDSVSTLGICSVEKLGRSLMFPPFRMNELKYYNNGDAFNFVSNDKEVVLIPYFADEQNPDIVIKLRIENQRNFHLWLSIFNKLFSPDTQLKKNQDSNFTERHERLVSLKNGTDGLDIRVPEPISPTSSVISPVKTPRTQLHKSKQLSPSMAIPQEIQNMRALHEPENSSAVVDKQVQLAQVERTPLAEKTNIAPQKPVGGHAYRAAMFQKLSAHKSGSTLNVNKIGSTPVVKVQAQYQHEPQQQNLAPVAPVAQIPSQSAPIAANRAIAAPLERPFSVENAAVSNTASQETQAFRYARPVSRAFTSHVTPQPESAPVESVAEPAAPLVVADAPVSKAAVPARTSSIKPSTGSVALNSIASKPQSVTTEDHNSPSALNVDQLITKEASFSKTTRRQRRKSIFNMFGLIKKSHKNSEQEADGHSELQEAKTEPTRNTVLSAPQNNASNTTLTTQETITHSKSNKNINKLTIDTSFVNKLPQSPQFEELSAKKIQTATTTPGSFVPSPFAFPEFQSPTVELSEEARSKVKNSKVLCNFNCRVSKWNNNKWEIIGGKEIAVTVTMHDDGGFLTGASAESEATESENWLIALPLSQTTTVRRPTALDIQLKTRESESPSGQMVSTLIRCSKGAHAELLIKAVELAKMDPSAKLSAKDSMTSLNSSMYTSSLSSNSLASKNAFNSATSIYNNNLADDIFNLGKPKIGSSAPGISPSVSTFSSVNDLYFTPPSSAVDLTFNTSSSNSTPNGSHQLLLLLCSMKIRVHEKAESNKWEPKTISNLEAYALESMPGQYHLKIPNISVDHLIKSENVLRVGKAGVLLSVKRDTDETAMEYMLEFKGKKLADHFYEIINKS